MFTKHVSLNNFEKVTNNVLNKTHDFTIMSNNINRISPIITISDYNQGNNTLFFSNVKYHPAYFTSNDNYYTILSVTRTGAKTSNILKNIINIPNTATNCKVIPTTKDMMHLQITSPMGDKHQIEMIQSIRKIMPNVNKVLQTKTLQFNIKILVRATSHNDLKNEIDNIRANVKHYEIEVVNYIDELPNELKLFTDPKSKDIDNKLLCNLCSTTNDFAKIL